MNIESASAPLLFSVPEARQKLGGISHSGFYVLVKRGLIRLTKIGRRSFVTHPELLRVVAVLEAAQEEDRRNLAADDSHELRPSAA